MVSWSNISFLNPEFLLLLVIIPIVIFWQIWRKPQREVDVRMSDLSAFTDSKLDWISLIYPILRALAFTLLTIAIARPQQTLKEEEINAEGIDIMIAMDVSLSMQAQDFKPDRMTVSKSLAQDFVLKRTYDRIGLVIFGGESYSQSPLTTDHQIVNTFLSQLQAGMLGDGTAIGMGLASSLNRLKESESKSKVIILLTDGVNNSGYIDPYQAANIAKELGIKVYSIGIGSNGFANGGGRFNRRARVELDEKLLYHIANESGGYYYRAESSEDLESIYNAIDQLEKTKIEVNVMKRYTEEYRPFLIGGLLILLLEFLLSHTFIRKVL